MKFFVVIIAGFVFSVVIFNFVVNRNKTPELGIFVDAFVDNYLSRHSISKETFEKKWTLKEPTAEIFCDNAGGKDVLKIIVNENVYVLHGEQDDVVKIDESEFDEKFSSLSYDEKVKDYVDYGKFVCLYK